MKKQDLVALLKSVSMDELKKAIPVKERMEKLEKRKRGLEKDLASVNRQIESVLLQSGAAPPARMQTRKSARKGTGRRRVQPSLSSLVVEILEARQKPLRINDICDALLTEKNYKTRAKDFKAQIRVMMYRNEKGLFKKAGPGLFKLAGDAKPKAQGSTGTKGKSRRKAKTKAKARAEKRRRT